MKRNIARIAVLVTAAVAVLTVTSRLIGAGATEPEQIAVTGSGGGTGYVVKTHNGKVAMFTDEFTDVPAVETDIDAEGLRAYDRALLAEGIEVGTYEDVLRLIEDLSS